VAPVAGPFAIDLQFAEGAIATAMLAQGVGDGIYLNSGCSASRSFRNSSYFD
jgi:hypothetical protein